MDLTRAPAQRKEWAPARVRWSDSGPAVEWRHIGSAAFTDPFFEQTIAGAFHRPFSLLFAQETPIEFLDRFNAEMPILPPSGFIFHLSRCGSTVVSQMLAAAPEILVISEAPPIDFPLRLPHVPSTVSDSDRRRWLKLIIAALGVKRSPAQSHYVIKFDAWHICYFDFIREAFPNVPWIFIYRDPVEVLVSHRDSPSALTMPGFINPRVLGLAPYDMAPITATDYCARVLGHSLQAAAVAFNNAPGLLVNYTQIPDVVDPTLLEFFGLNLPPESRQRVRAQARMDAKNPAMTFTFDSLRKQQQAGDELRAAAERFMRPAYDALENLRAIQRRNRQPSSSSA